MRSTRLAALAAGVLVLSLALPAAAAFALSGGRVLRARLPLSLLLFFAWTACSPTWSVDGRLTLRAVTGTGLLLALGMMLAWGRTTHRVARLVLGGATAVSAVAVATAFVRPANALSAGNLKGLAPHENQLAFVAVVGLVVAAAI